MIEKGGGNNMKSVDLETLQEAIENNAIIAGARDVAKYKDNQRTDEFECVSVKCLLKNLGEIQLILSYRAGLADEINEKYPFASALKISDLGEMRNIKISLFKDNLNIKIFID